MSGTTSQQAQPTAADTAWDAFIGQFGFSPDGSWNPKDPAVNLLALSAKEKTQQIIKTEIDSALKRLDSMNPNTINKSQIDQLKAFMGDFADIATAKRLEIGHSLMEKTFRDLQNQAQRGANSSFQQAKDYRNQAATHRKAMDAATDIAAKAAAQEKYSAALRSAAKSSKLGAEYTVSASQAGQLADESRKGTVNARTQYNDARKSLSAKASKAQIGIKAFNGMAAAASFLGVVLAGDAHKGQGLEAQVAPYAKAATGALIGVGTTVLATALAPLFLASTVLAGSVLAPALIGVGVGIAATTLFNGVWDYYGWDKFFEGTTLGDVLEHWLPDTFGDWRNLNRSGFHYFYDPLVLDLNGNGRIDTLGVDINNRSNNAFFDFDGDNSQGMMALAA